MDSKTVIINKICTVEWYVRMSSSVDVYTHIILDNTDLQSQLRYRNIIKTVKVQEYARTATSICLGWRLG